jgi:hypothetical protein
VLSCSFPGYATQSAFCRNFLLIGETSLIRAVLMQRSLSGLEGDILVCLFLCVLSCAKEGRAAVN